MIETFQFAALQPVLPELLLAVGAMTLLMIGAITGERAVVLVTVMSILLLAVAGLCVVIMPATVTSAFGGSFVVDAFARFMKILMLTGSGVAILLAVDFLRPSHRRLYEFPILILLAATGMMMMISAGDLIALYLGLELMSLSLYVVAAIDRDNVRSTEAGLKYFVLGALSSGMLLYGASLIYGFTGTVNFAGIAKVAGEGGVGLTIGLV